MKTTIADVDPAAEHDVHDLSLNKNSERNRRCALSENSKAMIQIELNGAAYEIEPNQNVDALIEKLSLSGKAVAVAINRQIVPRSQWQQKQLQAADQVDVVRAIGGG